VHLCNTYVAHLIIALKLYIKDHLGQLSIVHLCDMNSPVKLCCHEECFYATDLASLWDLSVSYFLVPFDASFSP